MDAHGAKVLWPAEKGRLQPGNLSMPTMHLIYIDVSALDGSSYCGGGACRAGGAASTVGRAISRLRLYNRSCACRAASVSEGDAQCGVYVNNSAHPKQEEG